MSASSRPDAVGVSPYESREKVSVRDRDSDRRDAPKRACHIDVGHALKVPLVDGVPDCHRIASPRVGAIGAGRAGDCSVPLERSCRRRVAWCRVRCRCDPSSRRMPRLWCFGLV